jgi:hypothetical protein
MQAWLRDAGSHLVFISGTIDLGTLLAQLDNS